VTSDDATQLPNIAGFTLLRQIGRGGFSTVYAAVQEMMGREVAVKVLNTGFEDERQQRTFERECQVMGRVSRHPSIVTVYQQVMTVDGRPGIAMELYDSTFRDLLRTSGPLPVDRVLDVGVRVADALQTVHDAGILHRDIKPHNVFISAYGEPALADFGISSITGERSITGGGGFSIDYSAPEVLGDAEPGVAADVYALGATLYHLLSGEVPFPHKGPPESRLKVTVGKIVSSPPPSLDRHDAPESLSRLLRRCMAKDADHRPASAAELADLLRGVQAEMGLARTATVKRQDDPPPPEPERVPFDEHDRSVTIARPEARPRSEAPPVAVAPVPVPERRRTGLLIGVGVVLVLVAVVAAFGLLGRDPASSAVPTTTAPPIFDDEPVGVLDAPTDLRVTTQPDSSSLVEWTATEDETRFQVTLVGSEAGEPELVEGTSFVWPALSNGSDACFEVRTVADGRMSVAAAGPTCASAPPTTAAP
jgi:serine/threonine protein kinase